MKFLLLAFKEETEDLDAEHAERVYYADSVQQLGREVDRIRGKEARKGYPTQEEGDRTNHSIC